MPPQLIEARESFADFSYPKAGINVSVPYTRQPAVQMPNGDYGKTTPTGINVRSYDALDRLRGCSRPGLAKYLATAVGSITDWIVQEINQLTFVGTPSGNMQTNSSGRIVYLVACSQGDVFYTTAGDTTWTEATNNTSFDPPLNSTGIVRSAINNQKLYFADGVHWAYFDPSSNSVETWTPSAGILPVDGSSNTPRLITTWRGRTVLSGIIEDPQNWFMSKVADPTNFDYSPSAPSAATAIAGNNAPQGFIGDVVTGLCPYSDDVLLFFGDHSIYMMRGDPLSGGQIDLVSDRVGAAWGQAWCKDPYGRVFFFSNETGIYTLVPGDMPQRISQPIESLISDVNTGTNTIRLLWNDRFQGVHVFVTPTSQAAAATHLFYEARSGAWWQDTFANKNHNPLCCVAYDGNLPSDRVSLIGSWDGYVRSISEDATDDDGYDISSEVILGPITTKDLDDILFKDIQAILGETSGDVTYAVHVGTSAEQALSNDPVQTGTWEAGRNFTTPIRSSGYAIYVKLTSTNAWALEAVRVRVADKGKVRRRGK